jgi:hypothetical protein
VATALAIDQSGIEQFSRRWRVKELALFGSVLRDNFGPQSDLDVLVSFEPDAPWTLWDLSRMREELEELFGRKVDLIEQEGLENPFLRHAILTTKRVIYSPAT